MTYFMIFYFISLLSMMTYSLMCAQDKRCEEGTAYKLEPNDEYSTAGSRDQSENYTDEVKEVFDLFARAFRHG
jgi:hypothetical protein